MSHCITTRRSLFCGGILALAIACAASAPAMAQEREGAVYVNTNQSTGNMVAAFLRSTTGTLTSLGMFSTGGMGFSGIALLGSQGAIAITPDGHFIFAVNAGSNTIAAFSAKAGGLVLLGTVESGGTKPVSLTLHKDLLYVLNASGKPNIKGFSIQHDGALAPLAGSERPLVGGAAADPAQVAFSPDGSFLVVTEKGTNLIDTYAVQSTGVASAPISNPSNGLDPFGMAFTLSGTLVVSEGLSGSVSSYAISSTGSLELISGSVTDTQNAPCWVVIPDDGNLAFVVNNSSPSISSYSIAANGDLVLTNATAGTTPSQSGSIDAALSFYNQYLYVIASASGSINAFQVGSDGNLTSLPEVTGLPLSSQGIVAQ